MKRFLSIALALVVISFIIALSFYPFLPEEMPSHWDVSGEVDSYLPKIVGVFLFPILTLGLFVLFAVIPHIDPKKTNIKRMEKYYGEIVILIMGFIFYIYLLVILWALGIRMSMNSMIISAVGALLYVLGAIMNNLKSNWFIGIRTPWTLSSDRVWKKTHALGGKLFKVTGIITIVGILFGSYAIWFLSIPLLASVALIIVYSFYEYQKEGR